MVAASMSAGSGLGASSVLMRARYVVLINYRATKPDHLGYQPSQPTRSIPPGLARGSVRSESLAASKTHLRPRALFVCASVAGFGRMCAAGGARMGCAASGLSSAA